MESISKILKAISAEGRSSAEKIIENGRNSAEKLTAAYDREARIAADKILDKAQKTVGEIQHRSISQAGIEGRNIKLLARRNALEQAFEQAGEKLALLSKEQKTEMYEKLIRRYSSGKSVIVQLNTGDKKILGGKLKTDGIKISIDDETGDFSGGLIIKEGDIETNCTLEVIMKNAKTEMESEIAAMLFL